MPSRYPALVPVPAADVDSARTAARELDQLSTELTRLINVFTV